MLNKFLEEKNIQANEAIVKDIERLTKRIDTENVKISNKYDVFNNLAKAFIQIQKHVDLLEKMGKKDTDYHEELNIIEQFIKYLIELYSFEQDFEKLIKRQANQAEFKVSNQTFVDDTNNFDFDEVDLENEDIEVDENDIEVPELKESIWGDLDVDIED